MGFLSRSLRDRKRPARGQRGRGGRADSTGSGQSADFFHRVGCRRGKPTAIDGVRTGLLLELNAQLLPAAQQRAVVELFAQVDPERDPDG
ncbi:hypothetical protein ACWDA8_45535, partial [Streptomyces sp. NPDC001130]